ncbi:MAG: rRNA maturation RNase YbeY [Vicingaceae bacterium]
MHFHQEDIDFTLPKETLTKNWIAKTISQEAKSCGELNFIFCSDEYLLGINQEHLNHDTYTDIITFNYVEGELISGDIFISIARVIENAKKFNVPFLDELHRVMVHGVLHLIGYDDKSIADAQEIRRKEDFYLTLQPEI